MIGLTPHQQCLYDFIRDYMAKHGFAPTVREMAAGFGTPSPGRVHGMLRKLEERGAIRRIANRNRATELVDQDPLAGVPTAALVSELTRRGWFKPIGATA